MADNYNGQKDSTIVTTKDGSKLRKYRTPDGAIKYDKVKDDNDLFMQKLVESEKEIHPEKTDEEIDFDKNLYEMNIDGQLDYFSGNKFIMNLEKNGLTKRYPGDSVPDLYTMWQDAKKDGMSMQDFFKLLKESIK
jgi:hypothetical protein